MDYFDLTNGRGSLAAAFEARKARFLVISFSSDWLYPSYQSQEIVRALRSRNCDVAYCELRIELRARCVPGGCGRTNRSGARIPGEHVREAAAMSARRSRTASPSCSICWDAAITPLSAKWSSRGTQVLDLGCGEGELLAWLAENKGVEARGVEISGAKVQRAIARGVSVYQGDIDEGLADYPDLAFDYVILSQTLQETRQPLQGAARDAAGGAAGHRGVSEFRPLARAAVDLFTGRAPKTRLFPYDWYDSPNIHFLTVDDFEQLVRQEGLAMERRYFLEGHRRITSRPNLRAEVAVYLVRKN